MGMKYSIHPLAHLNKLRDTKVNGVKMRRVVPASPIAKINEIDEMAKKAGVPDVGSALKGIYNSTNSRKACMLSITLIMQFTMTV